MRFFKVLNIQKRIVSAETIRGNTVCISTKMSFHKIPQHIKAVTKYERPKIKRDARQKKTAFLLDISIHFRPFIFRKVFSVRVQFLSPPKFKNCTLGLSALCFISRRRGSRMRFRQVMKSSYTSHKSGLPMQ